MRNDGLWITPVPTERFERARGFPGSRVAAMKVDGTSQGTSVAWSQYQPERGFTRFIHRDAHVTDKYKKEYLYCR